jgi:iron complex transport system ATP-binding protein
VAEVNADAVLQLVGVTVRRGDKLLLDNVDWTVELDERWVIIGPNGAGKTTLLQIAGAMMHPTSGEAYVLGEKLGSVDVFELRPRIGFSSSALSQRIPGDETVIDVVVSAGYAVVGRWREAYGRRDVRRAAQLLDRFGVADLTERPYGTLSEGERKRVQIARAMMTDPELLLLDEPAAGMDLGGREDLVRRLHRLAIDPDAPTTVLVTHHVEEIPEGVTHAMLLRDGRIVRSGLVHDVIDSESLSETFREPIGVWRRRGRYFARAD